MNKCRYITALALTVALCCCLFPAKPVLASLEKTDDGAVLAEYEEYCDRLMSIQDQSGIEEGGFRVVEDQIFALEPDEEDSILMVPAFDKLYNRLAVFIVDKNGQILYRTEQLETNYCIRGRMRQPIQSIAAVSFQDLNRDGRMDIILITSCVNESEVYAGKTYKVGDVLFQNKSGSSFYRDYRISDKINRFGMNKSAESITSFVRDGNSTEFLYTASTLGELQKNGFRVIPEQCYFRTFGKLGKLQVTPGTYRIADYDIFMIYLVNEQGDIVSVLQPMGEYDNLYALKGVTCRDIDGDGLKDIVILARYSYEGEAGELVVEADYQIYYQRTGGFVPDTEIRNTYRCSDDDTMEILVEKARAYWGWQMTND